MYFYLAAEMLLILTEFFLIKLILQGGTTKSELNRLIERKRSKNHNSSYLSSIFRHMDIWQILIIKKYWEEGKKIKLILAGVGHFFHLCFSILFNGKCYN